MRWLSVSRTKVERSVELRAWADRCYQAHTRPDQALWHRNGSDLVIAAARLSIWSRREIFPGTASEAIL